MSERCKGETHSIFNISFVLRNTIASLNARLKHQHDCVSRQFYFRRCSLTHSPYFFPHLVLVQVVVSGRGRGRGSGQMGRGRPVATRQSQRVAESKHCTVSIEGLSSSTTDIQLKNLLRSIGPIEVGTNCISA